MIAQPESILRIMAILPVTAPLHHLHQIICCTTTSPFKTPCILTHTSLLSSPSPSTYSAVRRVVLPHAAMWASLIGFRVNATSASTDRLRGWLSAGRRPITSSNTACWVPSGWWSPCTPGVLLMMWVQLSSWSTMAGFTSVTGDGVSLIITGTSSLMMVWGMQGVSDGPLPPLAASLHGGVVPVVTEAAVGMPYNTNPVYHGGGQ